MFKPQPAFCSNCGTPFEAKVEFNRWVVCSSQCYTELYWKNVLYIMGKEYYPQPEEDKK